MRSIHYIVLSTLLLVMSCHKKDKHPDEETQVSPAAASPDTGLKCQDLPPPPTNFQWLDSFPDGNKTITAFLFDPINPDKIIYVAKGDAFGYNKLFFYNIPLKQAKYICTLGKYLPQVNQKGWITFSDATNNVFFIKNNSETLIPLSTDLHSHNPKWDHTGNYIYYYTEAFFNVASQMLKIDTAGAVINNFDADIAYFASYKKSDKLLILEPKNSLCTLKIRNPGALDNERILLTGPLYSKPGRINFDNLTLDNNDENIYWSNSNGIFKCNLATLKVDTLFGNCQNFIFNNPIISFKENELTYSHEVITPMNSIRLYHRFRAMEMNLLSRQSSEIKIYP